MAIPVYKAKEDTQVATPTGGTILVKTGQFVRGTYYGQYAGVGKALEAGTVTVTGTVTSYTIHATAPVLTLNTVHRLAIGEFITIAGAVGGLGDTISINGTFEIKDVPAADEVTISADTSTDGTYTGDTGAYVSDSANTANLSATVKYTYPEQYQINEAAAVPTKANPTGSEAGADGIHGEVRFDNTDPQVPIAYVVVGTNPVIWIKMTSTGF